MMRRRAAMRRGPGLVRTVARTAVIAGTATVASNAVSDRMDRRQMERAQQDADATELQQYRRQEMPPEAAGRSASGDDMIARLRELAEMKSSGILSDAEFNAAKAKLLAS
jgi:hypothetical protein